MKPSVQPNQGLMIPYQSDFPLGSLVWLQKPSRLNEIIVHWSPRDKFPSGYNVYRSLSPATIPGMERIATMVEVPLFRDTTIEVRNLADYWYVVTEVMGDGTETPLSDPVNIISFFWKNDIRRPTISMPRIYLEYVSRKYIILENDGERVDYLIRKIAGQRCSCFNPNYEQSSQATCLECFGVGYVGGYERIPDVLMRILPHTENRKITPWGISVETNPPGWLADWPVFRNGDVVVRREGSRYTVGNLSVLMHSGILTEQNMDLQLIDFNHPVYRFPLH